MPMLSNYNGKRNVIVGRTLSQDASIAYYTITVKHLAKVPSAFCSFTTSADHPFRTASISFSVNCKANFFFSPHAVKPDPLPLLQTATPQTFQIKNGSSCSRPCVLGASRRLRQPEWDLEEGCEGGCRGEKNRPVSSWCCCRRRCHGFSCCPCVWDHVFCWRPASRWPCGTLWREVRSVWTTCSEKWRSWWRTPSTYWRRLWIRSASRFIHPAVFCSRELQQVFTLILATLRIQLIGIKCHQCQCGSRHSSLCASHV